MSKSYCAADYKKWEAAGLDKIMNGSEMEYVNQEEDGFDTLRGEWYIADDDTRTIIFGTFGNYNSPGASHYTYAEVYDDVEEYRAALAEWEAKPEYTEEYEAESCAYSVVVGNIGTVCDHECYDNAYDTYRRYVKQSKENSGRAAGESVTLFHGEEIAEEYEGTLSADSEDTEDVEE